MSLRILVAEDHARLADFCVEFLLTLGHRVIGPVPSMQKARDLISHETIDAAYLDVRLNDGLVFPLATELRTRNIPFFFCTGYGEDAEMPPDFDQVPRLSKPYTEDDLASLLNSLFAAR